MSNPSLQCSVCGQWKRLHGKDETGQAVQRFYPCCGDNGEFIHEKEVCDECCKKNCPYRQSEYTSLNEQEVTEIREVKPDGFEAVKKSRDYWSKAAIEMGIKNKEITAENESLRNEIELLKAKVKEYHGLWHKEMWENGDGVDPQPSDQVLVNTPGKENEK